MILGDKIHYFYDERTRTYMGIDQRLIDSFTPGRECQTVQAINSLIDSRLNRGGPDLPELK